MFSFYDFAESHKIYKLKRLKKFFGVGMAGVGEVVFGFILIGIFIITLVTVEIPIIWTGALIGGIISVITGFYHMAQSSRKPQQAYYVPQPQQMFYAPPPPPPQNWVPPQQKQTSRFCPHCGRVLDENSRFCGQCGKPI
jgi:hypothetical protein